MKETKYKTQRDFLLDSFFMFFVCLVFSWIFFVSFVYVFWLFRLFSFCTVYSVQTVSLFFNSWRAITIKMPCDYTFLWNFECQVLFAPLEQRKILCTSIYANSRQWVAAALQMLELYDKMLWKIHKITKITEQIHINSARVMFSRLFNRF